MKIDPRTTVVAVDMGMVSVYLIMQCVCVCVCALVCAVSGLKLQYAFFPARRFA